MIKKFGDYITELKYSTYNKAAKKLDELGHKSRSKKLIKHSGFNRNKVNMVKNYPDLRPFEIGASIDKNGCCVISNEPMTVYLSGWEYIPSEDNECDSVDIGPVFLYNSKEPYFDKSNVNLFKNEESHRKGLDEIINLDYTIQFSYYGDGFNPYSFEGGQGKYLKFTNRRDAVRFKKIIQSDEHFLEELIEATKGCDEIDAFETHKIFKTININQLYSE